MAVLISGFLDGRFPGQSNVELRCMSEKCCKCACLVHRSGHYVSRGVVVLTGNVLNYTLPAKKIKSSAFRCQA